MSKARVQHNEKIKAMLMDTNTRAKKYWKIAKEVYGSKNIMGIPSLMAVNVKTSTSFNKANLFNNYFAEDQTLPPRPFNQQLPPIQFLTNQRLQGIKDLLQSGPPQKLF